MPHSFDHEVCRQLNNMLTGKMGMLESAVAGVYQRADDIANAISDVAALSEAGELKSEEEIISGIDNIVDAFDGNAAVGMLDTLRRCLTDMGELGINNMAFNGAVNGYLNNRLSNLMPIQERDLLDLLNRVKDRIPHELLDDIFNLIMCLGNCPQGSGITMIEVEDRLQENRVTSGGNIDLASFSGANQIGVNRMHKLSEKKENAETELMSKVQASL